MKKISFLLLFFIASCIYGQEVFNGDFETWVIDTLCEHPDEWQTQQDSECATLSTIKETDAQHGDFSLKLFTADTDCFGFAVLGEVYGSSEGELPVFKGIPWSQTVDTLHFWLKSEIQTGDSGLVIVQLSVGGNVFDMQFFSITQSYNNWTEIKLGFNPLQIQPDSLFIGFVSSSPTDMGGNPIAGTWIMIDNVYLTLGSLGAQFTVPNYSFENWSYVQIEDPAGWTSSNYWIAGYGIANVTKTTDSHSGDYAARLEVIQFHEYIVQGILSNGDNIDEHGGIPYTNEPEFFLGAYKYSPVGTDTAFIHIDFKKDGNYIAGNSIQITTPGSINFVEFDISTNLFLAPDTMRIYAISGKNVGSVLIIDDFDLLGGNVGVENISIIPNHFAYPMPVSDYFYISYYENISDNAYIKIYDIGGKVVREINNLELYKTENRDIKISVSDLAPGTYIYEMLTGEKTINGKLLIVR